MSHSSFSCITHARCIKVKLDFRDNTLVVNKPVGLVVHPGAGNRQGTLVNALIHHCGDSLSGIGGVERPGIVHRLDKDTSGLLVTAKNEQAHQGLVKQFMDHGRTGPLERSYLGLAWGQFSSKTGTVNAPLARSPSNSKTVLPKVFIFKLGANPFGARQPLPR